MLIKFLNGSEKDVADLRSANLRSADLQSANLQSADLRSADLQSANLQFADLQSADLQSANLQFADLRSANLRSADLQSANLQSADLQFADLQSANLRSALIQEFVLHSQFPFIQFVNVGSRNDTLTVFISDSLDTIYQTGCFRGTAFKLLSASLNTHGDSLHGLQYLHAVKFITATIEAIKK